MKQRLYLLLVFAGTVAGCSNWNLEPKELKATALRAAFSVTNDGCSVPCTITFTNQSTNATSYAWNFGDGSTSNVESPSKQYTQAGTFTVKLTVSGPGGSNTTQQTVTLRSSALSFTWRRIADFPGNARSDAGVIVIGKKVYIAGGNLAPETQTDEVWEFDSETGQWTQKASLPRKGAYATGFAYNNTGFLTGLYTQKQAVPGQVLVYNPATNQWTARSDSKMNRTFCSACILDQRAFIGIGQTFDGNNSANGNTLQEYNMVTGTSTAIPLAGIGSRLEGLLGPIMFPFNGKCVIGGGALIFNTVVSFPTTLAVYDPNAVSKFDTRPEIPRAINLVGVVGGRYFGFTEDNTRVYEYKNDEWEQLPGAQSNTPPVQIGSIKFGIGNTFYMGLGSNTSGVRNKEIWTLTVN